MAGPRFRHAVVMPSRPSRAGLAGLALMTLVACSNSRDPNEANFRKALEPVVEDVFCRSLQLDRLVKADQDETAVFPITVSPKPSGTYGARTDQATIALLDDAAARGLLVRTESEGLAKRSGSSEQPARRRLVSYAPTPRAGPYFRAKEWSTSTNRGVSPALCLAKAEPVDIVRWSDPVDMLGRTMTRVTYRFRGIDPVEGYTAEQRALLETPKERTTTLVLNNDGWGLPE